MNTSWGSLSSRLSAARTGCSDDEMPWERTGDTPLDTKYPFVCHAELNAILNSRNSVEGCTLYVTLFPCNECAKAIIQSGIKRVVYFSNKYAGTDSVLASELLFRACGVEMSEYIPSGKEITLKL